MCVFDQAFKERCIVDKDSSISVKDFKKAIEKYVYLNYKVKKIYVHAKHKHKLKQLGFATVIKKFCGNCGKPTNRGKCCSNYSNKKRHNKPVILHLKLGEKMDPKYDDYSFFEYANFE